jgi:prepilin-type processing-associated H-X9-DG protein
MDNSTSQVVNNGATAYPMGYAYNSNIANGGAPITNAQFEAPANTVVLAEVSGNVAYVTATPEEPYTATAGTISAAGNGNLLWDDLNETTTGKPLDGALYVTGSALGLANAANVNTNGYFSSAAGLHTGGANYLAADGHVKWFMPQNISSGFNGTDMQTEGYTANTTSTTAPTWSLTGPAAATDDPTNRFALTFSYT